MPLLITAAKVIGICLFLMWVCAQYLAIVRGRRLSTRKSWKTAWNLGDHRRMAHIAYRALWTTLVFAELAHLIARRQVGGAHGATFYVHLPAAIILLFAMTVMRRQDGLKSPQLHRWLALVVVLCSPIVAVTGAILLVNL